MAKHDYDYVHNCQLTLGCVVILVARHEVWGMTLDRNGVISVGLILTEMYPFYGAVLATESMRLANKYANRKAFDWAFISEDGTPVAASNGMSLTAEAATNVSKLDYAIVIAGYDQDRTPHPRIKGLLRRLSRHGAVIGAVDSGAFVLAEARVLTGQATAIHFESKSSFQHRYPSIPVVEAPVSISPKVMTCGGGALVIRLILSITRTRIGEVIADQIEVDFHSPGCYREVEKLSSNPYRGGLRASMMSLPSWSERLTRR
jgi:AraC family carnitine catabolism transcriptional activator